jgi:hypothetical protein
MIPRAQKNRGGRPEISAEYKARVRIRGLVGDVQIESFTTNSGTL